VNRLVSPIILLIFICTPIYSQKKLISDTTIINVPIDSSLKKVNATIANVIDMRKGEEDVLRITQKNVYQFIPIDHYININKPLEHYIPDFFDGTENVNFEFKINRFEITERKGLFYPAYTLNALFDISKYSTNNGDTLAGTLIYNNEINARTKGKKPGQKEEKLIKQWEKDFVEDMHNLTKHANNSKNSLPYNFRKSNQTYRTNLVLSSRFIGGLDFWMLEGEVIFAEPEASRWFRQSGYMVRYRNEKKFESIAFTRNSEHFIYRLNDKFLFDINTNFMIGVIKWKDMWDVEHPIWHIVLLDLSASQYIKYTPFNNKPSFVMGAGILENVYYVPDGIFKFKPGIGIQLGYRF
jgi:hypothetical protein